MELRYHIGRSFTGTRLEDECPCPKEPCGLVASWKAVPECEQHHFSKSKTIRTSHPEGSDLCIDMQNKRKNHDNLHPR